jgi:DNA-binding MarR family transcriptional regulator
MSDLSADDIKLLEMLSGRREKLRTNDGAYDDLVRRGYVERSPRGSGEGRYIDVTPAGHDMLRRAQEARS